MLPRSLRWLPTRATWSCVLLGLGFASCGGIDGGSGGLEPPPPKGSLAVTLGGLPEGGVALVQVSGPGGFTKTITASELLKDLTPGSYAISAVDVTASGHTWSPDPALQDVPIAANVETPAAVQYSIATGALTITVIGLPVATPSALTLSGPGGFQQAVSGTTTITGLLPGTYTLIGSTVSAGSAQYAPTIPDVPPLTKSAAPVVVTVAYTRQTGSIELGVSGLPAGVAPSLALSGPGGYASNPAASGTLSELDPGSYTLTASPVTSGGNTWTPSAPSQVLNVAAGASTSAAVSYAVSTGRLTLTITGLPGGAAANVTVTGPGGFNQHPVGTQTFTGLVPGSYAIEAASVVANGHTYTPAPVSQTIPVPASTSTTTASLAYTLTTGTMTVSLSGLPGGTSGSATITGPGGFNQTIAATTTFTGLTPGAYTVTAPTVNVGGQPWLPFPQSQQVNVVASLTGSAAAVTWSQATGALAVTVSGLPGGTNANVTVSGPGGFTLGVTGSQTLNGIPTGSYTITAANVSAGGQTWAPSPPSQSVSVVANTTTNAVVGYSPTLGGLTVTISGLPGGAGANVTVTGPGGFSQNLTATTTFSGLTPGSYTVAASNVSSGGTTYAPTPASQNRTVSAGATATATVTYASTVGALTVTISGLPGGTNASVLVTGPGGFSQNLTATTTLSALTPGSYTIAASNVTSGPTTYTPAPTSQNRTVSAGATATATVAYTSSGGGGGTLNLRIDGLYVTQAAQSYDGTAPLVAGRDGYLRVFALANQANTAQPQVRVRLYSSGALVQTWTLGAPGASVPLSVNEGSLTASWNILVPATLMQPNLTVLADVDPSGALAETNEGDNNFPVSGTPGPVDVRALPTFNVRFVPVLQSVNGLQGAVNAGSTGSFLADVRTLLPVGPYDADVRAVYTTSAPALVSDNANGAWGMILSEVLALKSSDASTRYYYGVVKTAYSSGVAGIGYVGGGARTALGWDRMPSASGVMAHELGHNMGRNHAPCGGAGGPDPSYPYSGGSIGIWGLDVGALQLKSPATYFDLMGYCSPDWVSDYNWQAMVTFRQAGPNNTAGQSDSRTVGRGLLVWGRITSAGLVLEPAFVVDNADLAAPPAGPHLIEARDANGRVIFSTTFAAAEVADLTSGREGAFAFVVPAGRALAAEIAELRLVSGARSVSRRPSVAAPPAPVFARGADGRGLLQWDARLHPVVLVRDAVSGQILSFARGGSVRLPAGAARIDATFSDGTRSTRRLLNR